MTRDERQRRGVAPDGRPRLTLRTEQVLQLLALGRTPKQMARELGISIGTCRGHVQDLLVAFDTQSALYAVLEAQQHGLVPCRCGHKRVTDTP